METTRAWLSGCSCRSGLASVDRMHLVEALVPEKSSGRMGRSSTCLEVWLSHLATHWNHLGSFRNY